MNLESGTRSAMGEKTECPGRHGNSFSTSPSGVPSPHPALYSSWRGGGEGGRGRRGGEVEGRGRGGGEGERGRRGGEGERRRGREEGERERMKG